MLHLQHQVGNAHVARMVAQQDEDLLLTQPEVGIEGGVLSEELSARIQSKVGGGTPLEPMKRKQMERTLGASLDDVHLHTDDEADAISQQIKAKAFTIGSDIFLSHAVDPDDAKLLVHELAHVVQQRSMLSSGPLTVGPANDQFEQAADVASQKVVQDVSVNKPALSLTSGIIQREWWEDVLNIGGSIPSAVKVAGKDPGLFGPLSSIVGIGTGLVKAAAAAGRGREKRSEGDELGAMEEEVNITEAALGTGFSAAGLTGPEGTAASLGWNLGYDILGSKVIAPLVYGDKIWGEVGSGAEGGRMVDVPYHETFEATTGNDFMDWVFGVGERPSYLGGPEKAGPQIEIPMEPMTEEEGEEMMERKEAHDKVVAEWTAYDKACREANQRHEEELEAWRQANEESNLDPSKPRPGPRPRLQLPPRPASERPPSMGSY